MHRKLHMIVIAGMLVALAVVSVASGTSAGPLDPTAGPTNTNAYTLEQLWNRLSAGAAGTPSAFTEPSSGPDTGTMHTLDEIMAVAPAVDDTNGASATEVVSGKKFWGLTTAGWGVNSGTAAVGSNISGANGSLTFAIPNGFYTGKTATAQDPALMAGNIREGATIFGVAGGSKQASGNAVAGDVLLNKTFSNDGAAGLTGSMPNRGAVILTPGPADVAIVAGYHNGSGTVVGDTDLTAGNIRQGANIFGVAGSSIEASGNAVAGDVLLNKTFSNDGAAGLTGSMPNRGAVILTPGPADVAIVAGYHNGSGTVVGDTDLTAGNIRQGANIFGVAGSSIEASGNAVAGDVLLNKTFSNDGAAGLTGSMPNRGAVILTPGPADVAIVAGYHNGSGTVVGDTDLTAGNIRQGANIFGVAGTSIQASGDASAGEVLAGKTFSKAGAAGLTGSMPNRGAVILTPGPADVAIVAGYHNGSGTVVGDTDLTAGNIRQGANIFGVAGSSIEASGNTVEGEVLAGKTFSKAGAAGLTGSMPNRGAVILTPGPADVAIVAGYHNGSGTVVGDTDLTAGNIRQGANIFGVAGSSIQASGNAVEGEVLAGRTFSKAGAAGLTGSMPNRGAVILTPGPADVAIVAGYHNGSGTVVGDTDLTAGNIKKDVNVFGVTGEYRGWTCTGTLTPLGRWCDNGNGTIRDMTTGLIWLKKADWGGQRRFWESTQSAWTAHDMAALLHDGSSLANLSDDSVVGDWRLPTLTELKTLTSGTEAVSSGNPQGFAGIGSAYWSSTADSNVPTLLAWYVNPAPTPTIALYNKNITMGVWPVRNGQ